MKIAPLQTCRSPKCKPRPRIGEWQSIGNGLMRIIYAPENAEEATLEEMLPTP
jgi:hypothetical protein